MRSANSLVADNLIKIHTVSLPRVSKCSNVDRQIIFDARISLDSPTVAEFIKDMHDRSVIGNGRASMVRALYEVVNEKVELEDEDALLEIAASNKAVPVNHATAQSADQVEPSDSLVSGIDQSDIAPGNEPADSILAAVFQNGIAPVNEMDFTFSQEDVPFVQDVNSMGSIVVGMDDTTAAGGDLFADGPFAGFVETDAADGGDMMEIENLQENSVHVGVLQPLVESTVAAAHPEVAPIAQEEANYTEAVEQQSQAVSFPIEKGKSHAIGAMISNAENLGFINAKFLRCKALHEFLFEITRDPNDPKSAKNNGIFGTASLFRDMPFRLYLQVVGFFSEEPDAEIEAFLAGAPIEQEPTLGDITGHLRMKVTSNRTRQRTTLRTLIGLLCALGLLEPVESAKPDFKDDMYLKYKVTKKTALYSYECKVPMFLRYVDLKTDVEIRRFWAVLQYCSDPQNRKSVNQKNLEADADPSLSKLDSEKRKALSGINYVRYLLAVNNRYL